MPPMDPWLDLAALDREVDAYVEACDRELAAYLAACDAEASR